MKHIITIIFLFLLLIVSPAVHARSVNENQLITELKVIDNDSTFRFVYLYDNAGNKVLETRHYKQGNVWVRLSQTEWVYNQGNCLNQTERVWKNDEWQNTYKIDYNYENGLLDNEIHSVYTNKIPAQIRKTQYEYTGNLLTGRKEYSNVAESWTLNSQTDFSYTTSHLADSVTCSVFQAGSVIAQYLSVNTYNSDSTLLSQTQKEKTANSQWTNARLFNWFYSSASKKLTSLRVKTWNPELSVWENSQRTDYEYNTSNQLVRETYQHWKTMCWESDLRYDYSYGADGNEIKKTLSKPIYHDWRGLISINYSDFTAGNANMMDSRYEFWGGTTGELVTSYIPFVFNNSAAIYKAKSLQISYTTSSDTIQSLQELNNNVHTIPVYPNPSDGIYYMNTQDYAVQSWSITDLSGRTLINQKQLFNSGVIDITGFPKGVYVLKVLTPTTLLTQKLIKE